MTRQPINPKEAFETNGHGAEKIVEQINTALQDGQRTVLVRNDFPNDFKKRVVSLYEGVGWVVTESEGALNFAERVPAPKTEKEALRATQVIANLVLLMNEQIQAGKRELGPDVVEQNLERISSGLDKKLETMAELAVLFTDKKGKEFERLLELAGWKLENSGDNMKLSAL